jgi:hypothetical protein
MRTLFEEIQAAARDGHLPCACAFALALRLKVEPLEVGQGATSLGVRITRCQLGLFGRPNGAEGRLVRSGSQPDEGMRAAIASRLVDGRLPCSEAWGIAQETRRSRRDVARATESLGVRISACQLGCFR